MFSSTLLVVVLYSISLARGAVADETPSLARFAANAMAHGAQAPASFPRWKTRGFAQAGDVLGNEPSSNTKTRRDRVDRRRRPTRRLDTRPTPAPTGAPSDLTTVHITNERDFALLLPTRQELVSDAEADGEAFCTPGSGDKHCRKTMRDGFIKAAKVEKAHDGAWIQVTGCLDPTHSLLDPSDDGGQLDVRFPNGAQCTFGGYGASFIELVEPSQNRFCLRCCRDNDDQVNCNSHQDRAGCEMVIPGTYDFPEAGIAC